MKSTLTKADLHKLVMIFLATIAIGAVLVILAALLIRITQARPTVAKPLPQLPAQPIEVEPPLVAAIPKEKTREELHFERLQEVYDEFGGIIYHGDSPPREVLIGGVVWQRTNARTVIEKGTNRAGVPYRYTARVYLSPDKTRRLAVHSREIGSNEFGVHLLVVEQVHGGEKLNGEELWIADGYQVTAQGYPTSISWFCASKSNDDTVWELPPHERRSRDGALIPEQRGDDRPEAMKREVGDLK